MIVRKSSGEKTDCIIERGLKFDLTQRLQQQWGSYRGDLINTLLTQNPEMSDDFALAQRIIAENSLGDWHWDWTKKMFNCNGPHYEWFYLLKEEKIQGVCIIYFPQNSKIDNQNIFYIDYLASAYWNRKRPGYSPKYTGIGRELINNAINYACNFLGYRPGFCLHSLPDAEGFYSHLGMTDFGIDSSKEDLRYYEASEKIASALGDVADAA